MATIACSIIIPVWNGEDVILDSLAAIFAHTDQSLSEIICVNNASDDHSAELIAKHYPQVKLLNLSVNLGFAGGVNVGIAHANGDIFILVNQDCIVHPNWLPPLLNVFSDPMVGIAGITILNPDKSINHAGAVLEKPAAKGVHLTEITSDVPYQVDYVTGAVFAIHRRTWKAVGTFDEGFYPAYFEETDYCYRAKAYNFQVMYVSQSKATHLFSGKSWQDDPVKHSINQYRSRYRFIVKHFDTETLSDFFELEKREIETNQYFEQGIGRIVAARHTLRFLPDIIRLRQVNRDDGKSLAIARQIRVRFEAIQNYAFSQLEMMFEKSNSIDNVPQNLQKQLQNLRQQEHQLLERIYFKPPSDAISETYWQRLFRVFFKRFISFISGRDYLLLAKLNTVHVARIDKMEKLHRQIEWRLNILETIHRYDN